MRLNTKIQIIASATLLLSLSASVALTPRISAEAGRAQLNYADRATEADPPEVALGIAMGAFRGLFVNLLWMQAQDLKTQGKFFEAIEVARAITKLQPRFPRVWVFHGWNLAYNVSVATATSSERWQWVNAGIELLRSEGIPKNPASTLIHKELAWIFVHKIQGPTDDAHLYYKRQLAREWTFVLGPPPDRPQPDDPDTLAALEARRATKTDDDPEPTTTLAMRDAMIDRRIAILEYIQDAPSSLEEFYEQYPGGRDLVRRLTDAGVSPDIELLKHVELQRAIASANSRLQAAFFQLPESERNREFETILFDPQHADAGQMLVPTVRKILLRDTYHMEIERMIRYTRRYGPFDWRHPASHAFYWSARGVEEGLRRHNTESFNIVNTDRVTLHASQELFRWGEIYYDLLMDTLDPGAHYQNYVSFMSTDFVEAYEEVMQAVAERAQRRTERLMEEGADHIDVQDQDRHFSMYAMGYLNFLRDVTRVYYRMGDSAMAAHYFEKLRNWPYHNLNDPEGHARLLGMTLDEFVDQELIERVDSPEVAASEIQASLFDAFMRGLLGQDRRVFQGQIQYAANFHTVYMQEQNRRTTADATNRMVLFKPRFADMVADALVQLFASNILSPDQSSTIWRRAPMGLREIAYDQLVNRMMPLMGDELFALFYPEPPNMEEYRALRDQLEANTDFARQRMIDFDVQ
ncbi:MAG: hypothetical protein ACF8GE_12430 [Phycisphaerales bacterium JB043]